MTPGCMQLLPQYKQRLDPAFLAWYLRYFNNTSYRIYDHWTAGSCGLTFADYTDCIAWDGTKVVNQANFPDTQAPAYATSDRNSDSCAIAIAGFSDASPNNLGQVQCHPDQLRMMVRRNAYHCLLRRAPVACIMGHGEAADDIDGYHDPQGEYGPEHGWVRWDLDCWIDPATLTLDAPLDRPATGYIHLMDWMRGETILQLQTATVKTWKT